MVKEVVYKGYATVPAESVSADGQLAMSMNLINKNKGGLELIPHPQKLIDVGTNHLELLYIHNITSDVSYDNYIYRNDDGHFGFFSVEHRIQSMNIEDAEFEDIPLPNGIDADGISSISSMGNLLIVFHEDAGILRYVWSESEESKRYELKYVPSLIPISFGLRSEGVVDKEVVFANAPHALPEEAGEASCEFDEELRNWASESVLGAANKFIYENGTAKGRFMYPFFVRYAYRLYDGSLTKHSAPVLMNAANYVTPIIYANDRGYTKANVQGLFFDLDYAIENTALLEELKSLKDIVKSVDIFISAPLYTYNQGGEVKGLDYCETDGNGNPITYADGWITGYDISCRPEDGNATPTAYKKNIYTPPYIAKQLGETIENGQGEFIEIEPAIPNNTFYYRLPRFDNEEMAKKVQDCSLFYLVKSIPVEDLEVTSERTVITLNEDVLPSLVARERMTDDFTSHEVLIPKVSYVYNSRLNIANLKKKLFKGFPTDTYFNYSTFDEMVYKDVTPYVFIKHNGEISVLTTGESVRMHIDTPLSYFYYPSTEAFKVVFKVVSHILVRGEYVDALDFYEMPLSSHNFLNGAVYFKGWASDVKIATEETRNFLDSIDTTLDVIISSKSSIYTSEVNNPYTFPAIGVSDIGTGEIIGMTSATKALSQGQFGSFPLLAFTSDGVWALSVSSDGKYTTSHPITRDVCINPKSITQLDGSVLFATSKGIMELAGSTSYVLTDILDGTQPLFTEYAHLSKIVGNTNDGQIELTPISDYIKDGGMIYDYKNKMVYLYNPNIKHAYVYSIESKMWGLSDIRIIGEINSYPYAKAIISDNGVFLCDLSTYDTNPLNGIIITRPLKLDALDVFKTINTVIQRGSLSKSALESMVCALYGSNNLEDWHLVWTARGRAMRGFRGTPYKYFRIVVKLNISPNDFIFGASIDYDLRYTNRLR